MGHRSLTKTAAGDSPQRLFYYSLGFAYQTHLRRILQLSGYDLQIGLPQPHDLVAVWGKTPVSARGEKIAAWRGASVLRIEDAFIRSIQPGRLGEPPLGVILDPIGVHFDPKQPSKLEQILASDPLDDTTTLARAKAGLARMRALDLSKYNDHDAPAPPAGYVLVIDQTRGDAALMGADAQLFRTMLSDAQTAHPTAKILIKTHPETALGLRQGHFGPSDATGNIAFLTQNVSPWAAVEGAIAVYTVSSQLGFEAIMAGHRPHVYGQPFYAGWGLSVDQTPHPRRRRTLSKTQLFAVAMILAPTWYDPFRDRLCSFEEALDLIEARLTSHRCDRFGHVGLGMRMWKRARLQAVFGRRKPLIFAKNARKAQEIARKTGRGLIVWAGQEPVGLDPAIPCLRIEDGFVRSAGLGANLVPPLSLVADDLGIYYDPNRPSRLESLIPLPIDDSARARADVLIQAIRSAGLSKYNLAAQPCDLPPSKNRILVPGQVEDDASLRLGAGKINTNLALLRAARLAHPDAFIIYKPHPDVEAGLRPGFIPKSALHGLADFVADHADPIALITQCDRVFTMTSLLGFEAVLRGTSVTCTGAPFYAGWGLTQDLGNIPERRLSLVRGHMRPDVTQLAYAALIAYPRYFDPVTGMICPPEVVMHRLMAGTVAKPSQFLRLLSKMQGRFASWAHLWR